MLDDYMSNNQGFLRAFKRSLRCNNFRAIGIGKMRAVSAFNACNNRRKCTYDGYCLWRILNSWITVTLRIVCGNWVSHVVLYCSLYCM